MTTLPTHCRLLKCAQKTRVAFVMVAERRSTTPSTTSRGPSRCRSHQAGDEAREPYGKHKNMTKNMLMKATRGQPSTSTCTSPIPIRTTWQISRKSSGPTRCQCTLPSRTASSSQSTSSESGTTQNTSPRWRSWREIGRHRGRRMTVCSLRQT